MISGIEVKEKVLNFLQNLIRAIYFDMLPNYYFIMNISFHLIKEFTNYILLKKNECYKPSITDGVHSNENFVEIIPVFSTFSNFFQRYTYRVLQTIQMKLILSWVWAERAV